MGMRCMAEGCTNEADTWSSYCKLHRPLAEPRDPPDGGATVDLNPALAQTPPPKYSESEGEGTGQGKRFDVFISYASPDKEVAILLAEELAKHGLTIWVDAQDIKAGQNWQEEIRRAINNSRLCLVLLSQATVPLKPWISNEWSAIQECSWYRRDFSVCHLELEDVDTPPFLRGWQRLECKQPYFDVEKLASEIAALVTLPPAQLAVQSEKDQRATERRFSEIWDVLRETKGHTQGRDDE